MNEQLTQQFRRRLEAMARSIRNDVEAIQEVAFQPSGGQVAGEFSNAPMHLGDRGTEEYMSQLSSTLLGHEDQIRQQVRDALDRLNDGTFGRCVSCGGEIAIERLEALPFASQCIQCASRGAAVPTPNLNVGRPHDPSDTLAPEGRMAESGRSSEGRFAERENLSAAEDREPPEHAADIYAAGTPGGGEALGGLAGSNVGRGDPQVGEIEDAMGNSAYEFDKPFDKPDEPIERPRDRR